MSCRNMKAMNGMRTFFSEETYNQWIGQDTHESRLNARLNTIGISLTSRLTPSSMFLSSPQPSAQTKSNSNICQEAGSGVTGQFVLKAGSDVEEKQSGLKSRSDDGRNEFVARTDVEAVQTIGSSTKPDDQFRKFSRHEYKLENTNMPLTTVKADVQNDIPKQEVKENGEVKDTQENAANKEMNGIKPVKSNFTKTISVREEANVAAIKVKKERFDRMSTLELPEHTCRQVLENCHTDDDKEIQDKTSTLVHACHIAETDDTVKLTSKLENMPGEIGNETEEISVDGNEALEVDTNYVRPVSFYKEDTGTHEETTDSKAINIGNDAPGESYLKASVNSNMRQNGGQFHRPGKGSDDIVGDEIRDSQGVSQYIGIAGREGGSRHTGTVGKDIHGGAAGMDGQGGSRQVNNEAVELEKAGNEKREHIALERMFYNVKDR